MAFFDKFPITNYDINKDGNKKLVVDILKRVVFREELIDEASLYYDYIVKDGETPEIVAHKFYGDASLHWVLLLLNEVVDPYFGWPISEASLEDFVDKKYPGKAFYIGNIDSSVYFADNEEVYVSSRGGTEYKSYRGLVQEWDPTHRKLVLYNTEGNFVLGDVLKGKTNGSTGDITRLVDIHSLSLHHFEDASTDYLYTKLDPLGTPPVNGQQVAIGLTGDAWASGSAGATFGDTILYSYINSLDGSVTTHSVVTPLEYERNLNESKRVVKILREAYLDTVITDFGEVIKS